MQSALILILANKQDLPEALSPAEITDILGLLVPLQEKAFTILWHGLASTQILQIQENDYSL